MQQLAEWVARVGEFWWLAPLSVVLFFGTLLVVPLLVLAMPADYFIRDLRRGYRLHPVHLLRTVLKNLLGLVVFLAGLLMLVTPGQGILTLLIGLGMLNFPGKRRLELHLVRRPGVHAAIDWIRRRGGRAPLIVPPVTLPSSRRRGRSPDR